MTLVVARKFGSTAWIAADTLISGGTLGLRDQDRALKIFAVDEATLVAYAGPPEFSHAILCSSSFIRSIGNLSEMTRCIQKHLIDTEADVDFIIVNDGTIASVKSGIAEFERPISWIGDQAGFKAFQKQYLALENGKDTPLSSCAFESGGDPQCLASLNIYNHDTLCGANDEEVRNGARLHQSMELVIGDLSIPTVGGEAVIGICSNVGARYLSFSSATSPVYKPTEDKKWETVDFGTASHGGYCFTTATPHLPAVSGWGAFFHQGQHGIYYSAQLGRRKFEIYKGSSINAEEFCDALTDKLGYRPFHCGSISASA